MVKGALDDTALALGPSGQGNRMTQRRTFLAGMAAVVSAPRRTIAQEPQKLHRVGVLSELPRFTPTEDRWRKALHERGYIEGRNVQFEFRWGDGSPETVRQRARELVSLSVHVILTSSHTAAVAAKHATTTIPIITMSADPFRDGLIASLNRPGGNVTGVTGSGPDATAKRVQLLKEVAPDIRVVAILYNPNHATNHAQVDAIEKAATGLRVATSRVALSRLADTEAAFAHLVARQAHAIVILQDPVTFQAARRIAELAMNHRLPASHAHRVFVEVGGLMSYGTSLVEQLELAALAADKVLKGANPADVPMQIPNKRELIINLKTARALGLTIPPSLLLRVDHIIE